MNSYVVLGHASEELNKRKTVPAKCILIVAEECGSKGTFPYQLFETLRNPEYAEILKNPVQNKAALETILKKPLSIYKEGDSYPNIHYRLLGDVEEDRFIYSVEPSGVYSLPGPESWVLQPGKRGFHKYAIQVGLQEDIQRVFRGAVYPKIDTKITFAGAKRLENLKTTQERLFEAYPGIYYNFLCRSILDIDTEVEELIEEHFPEKKKLMNVANSVAVIRKWLETKNTSGFSNEKRDAYNRLQTLLQPVYAQRHASNQTFNTPVDIYVNEELANIHEGSLQDIPDAWLNNLDRHYQFAPIHASAATGNVKALEYLLKKGANINIQSGELETPLIIACSKDHREFALVLLEQGCDIYSQDDEGKTALHYCTDSENLLPVLTQLLDKGADINQPDNDGLTPLHIAAKHNEPQIVQVLLQRGANMNLQNEEGNTPLMVACEEDNNQIVKDLIEANCDVNIQNEDGDTALHMIVEYDMLPSFYKLMARTDLRTDIQNKQGLTSLLLALQQGNAKMTEELVRKTGYQTKASWEKIAEFATKHNIPTIKAYVQKKLAGGSRTRKRRFRKNHTRRVKS